MCLRMSYLTLPWSNVPIRAWLKHLSLIILYVSVDAPPVFVRSGSTPQQLLAQAQSPKIQIQSTNLSNRLLQDEAHQGAAAPSG